VVFGKARAAANENVEPMTVEQIEFVFARTARQLGLNDLTWVDL
jgi:hypothetical protein